MPRQLPQFSSDAFGFEEQNANSNWLIQQGNQLSHSRKLSGILFTLHFFFFFFFTLHILICISFFFFFPLAVSTACEISQARDRIRATAVTTLTTVTRVPW